MTTTWSGMEIVKHDNCFFVSEASMQDAVYTSLIQRIVEYKIILSLMAYTTMLITRTRGGEIQSLEIENYISIPGIQIYDKKHISSDMGLFRHNITWLDRKFRDEFRKDQWLSRFRGKKIQVKLLKDNDPSSDISVDDASCQHVLKQIHNENGGRITKKNIMTESLGNMHCCQRQLLNMGVVEF